GGCGEPGGRLPGSSGERLPRDAARHRGKTWIERWFCAAPRSTGLRHGGAKVKATVNATKPRTPAGAPDTDSSNGTCRCKARTFGRRDEFACCAKPPLTAPTRRKRTKTFFPRR